MRRDARRRDGAPPPLVSVIAPAWRAEATLPAAVASLRAQTLADWELIITADDDRDYAALLEGAGLEDPRIRHLRTPSPASGPSAARNLALAAATGRFVAPLDADDAFDPDRLATLVPLAETAGAAIDGSRAEDADGRSHGVSFPPGAAPDFASVLSVAVPVFPVFRRTLLPHDAWEVRLRFAEDVLFNAVLWSRLVEAGHDGPAFAPRPMLRYAVRPDSLSHRADATAAAEAAYALMIEEAEHLPIAAALRPVFVATIARKRAINRAFAEAEAREPGLTFQAFVDRGGATGL